MVMTTVADVPAVLPVVDTAAIEDAAEEGVAGVLPDPPPDDPQPLSATSAVAAMTPQTRAAILIFFDLADANRCDLLNQSSGGSAAAADEGDAAENHGQGGESAAEREGGTDDANQYRAAGVAEFSADLGGAHGLPEPFGGCAAGEVRERQWGGHGDACADQHGGNDDPDQGGQDGGGEHARGGQAEPGGHARTVG